MLSKPQKTEGQKTDLAKISKKFILESAINPTVLRLAVFNRKINGGDFDSFIVKVS